LIARPILFVDHALALGGAEYAMLMILDRLDRDLWQPHLACDGGPLAQRAAELGVPVHTISLPRLRRSLQAPRDLWCGIQALRRAVRQIHAELIVSNTVRSTFYTAPAAYMTGTPLIWYRHDFWLGETRPRYAWVDTGIKRLFCTAAASLITNSVATAKRHPCREKITVIPNGIEIQRFNPMDNGCAFRQTYQIPSHVPVVGTLGRLCTVKGQDRFLRILAQIQATMPNVWGLVVGGAIFGEDNYATSLRRLAQDLQIDKQLIFTGQVADPAPALAAMDLFVQPGDAEAFGLVNVEAMAMAKPVVAFAHGALPEIVVNGQTGLLVQPGNEDALAGAVLQLLTNPDLCARMGEAGRERAMEYFSMDRVAAQVSDLFRQVLE
jgi:glycosyltransferase involved in cell wall biosynthesis